MSDEGVPLPFSKRSDLGVALLIFAKEREGSGTLKKREHLTHEVSTA